MINLYARFLVVAIGSSVLTLAAVKYLFWERFSPFEGRIMQLFACAVVASSTCGFIGIILVDGTRYAESPLFNWAAPIAIGSVFGVIACRQIFSNGD